MFGLFTNSGIHADVGAAVEGRREAFRYIGKTKPGGSLKMLMKGACIGFGSGGATGTMESHWAGATGTVDSPSPEEKMIRKSRETRLGKPGGTRPRGRTG